MIITVEYKYGAVCKWHIVPATNGGFRTYKEFPDGACVDFFTGSKINCETEAIFCIISWETHDVALKRITIEK